MTLNSPVEFVSKPNSAFVYVLIAMGTLLTIIVMTQVGNGSGRTVFLPLVVALGCFFAASRFNVQTKLIVDQKALQIKTNAKHCQSVDWQKITGIQYKSPIVEIKTVSLTDDVSFSLRGFNEVEVREILNLIESCCEKFNESKPAFHQGWREGGHYKQKKTLVLLNTFSIIIALPLNVYLYVNSMGYPIENIILLPFMYVERIILGVMILFQMFWATLAIYLIYLLRHCRKRNRSVWLSGTIGVLSFSWIQILTGVFTIYTLTRKSTIEAYHDDSKDN